MKKKRNLYDFCPIFDKKKEEILNNQPQQHHGYKIYLRLLREGGHVIFQKKILDFFSLHGHII